MIKMDGRDIAGYQIWERRDVTDIFRKVFKSLNDKIVNSVSSPSLSKRKNVGKKIFRSSSFRLRGF